MGGLFVPQGVGVVRWVLYTEKGSHLLASDTKTRETVLSAAQPTTKGRASDFAVLGEQQLLTGPGQSKGHMLKAEWDPRCHHSPAAGAPAQPQ